MKVLFCLLFTLLICIALVEPHWRHLTKHLHHSRHHRHQRQHRHARHKSDSQRYWHGPRYYRAPARPIALGYGSPFNAGCRCLDGACAVSMNCE
ncbi:hypothetical protein DdX_17484 [Ditylenchus destructor]|uniref:Uncharacterized protein n=1 Tax=Ditylenchus destructor TaxID=166010 RepID=A0AAD4MNF2_9BILA|nr:hypothetical protein DdX_17484 [Ditylenchus destructor]